MPTYEYECTACAHRFEQWQPFSAAALTDCPQCGQPKLHRLFGSGGAIIFKGSGFYETDYRRAEQSKVAEKANKAEASATAQPAATGGNGSSGSVASSAQPAGGKD